MNRTTLFHRKRQMFSSDMQSEAVYRNGRRVFVVRENRDGAAAWSTPLTRVKTALNYWRNGYKWRTSWILAQR